MTRYRYKENDINTGGLESKRPMQWSPLFAAIISVACLLAPGPAQAQWPNRAIRPIVSFGVGSSSDTIARIVAIGLSEQLSQRVIVENKVGGSSIIGTDAIA